MHDSSWIKLIVVLFFLALSGVSNWLKKRSQAERARNAARNPRPPTAAHRSSQSSPVIRGTTSRPTGPASWEEELRRLLEGETPSAPPARPPSAPPIAVPPIAPRTITLPSLRPAAPAPPMNVPPLATPRPTVVRPTIVRVPESTPAPLRVPTVTSIGTRDLASMSQSRAAYEKGQQLGTKVAAHIEKVPTQRVQLTTVTRGERSAELSASVAMFKNPRAARQAVIASIVLGAPRAFETTDAGGIGHF
jgi:hypothetical protein